MIRASFRELLGVGPVTGDIAPLVILLVGDLDPETAYSAVDELFGDLVGATPLEPVELKSVRSDLSVAMDAASSSASDAEVTASLACSIRALASRAEVALD